MDSTTTTAELPQVFVDFVQRPNGARAVRMVVQLVASQPDDAVINYLTPGYRRTKDKYEQNLLLPYPMFDDLVNVVRNNLDAVLVGLQITADPAGIQPI